MALADPDRVVAAKEMLRCRQRGIRKLEVQPAPRIRMSTIGMDVWMIVVVECEIVKCESDWLSA